MNLDKRNLEKYTDRIKKARSKEHAIRIYVEIAKKVKDAYDNANDQLWSAFEKAWVKGNENEKN